MKCHVTLFWGQEGGFTFIKAGEVTTEEDMPGHPEDIEWVALVFEDGSAIEFNRE